MNKRNITKIIKSILWVLCIMLLMFSCKPDDTDEIKNIVPDSSLFVSKPLNEYQLGNYTAWHLSSVPATFPETALNSGLMYGMNRALLSWYVIDSSSFYNNNSPNQIGNINNAELSKHLVRIVMENEVYPGREIPNVQTGSLRIFNLAFYPDERGPYNFDCNGSMFSAGLEINGKLSSPETRWGGIARELEERDFDFNYIDFWLMDPLCEDEEIAGKLVINLGVISEDVLRDGKQFREHHVNMANLQNNDTSIWGVVPEETLNSYSFEDKLNQDFGYDGLDDEAEQSFFSDYLNDIAALCNADAYQAICNDPCGDDYHGYRSEQYDSEPAFSSILKKYKKCSNPEGNSEPEVVGITGDDAYYMWTLQPDCEMYDDDLTFQQTDSYFEYAVDIDQAALAVKDQNYIVEIHTSNVNLANGESDDIYWYHFKIPINEYTASVGNPVLNISYKHLRFYLTGFNKPVVLRFANLLITDEYVDVFE
ncbi:MAG: cell surface protein SprA [Bacteroidales bacterium]|nr:cell surface protein SprA [Bacteroidales bacterium]